MTCKHLYVKTSYIRGDTISIGETRCLHCWKVEGEGASPPVDVTPPRKSRVYQNPILMNEVKQNALAQGWNDCLDFIEATGARIVK